MSAVRGPITAVVLGGGEASDVLALYGGVEAKALVPVGDQPMAAYVLDALRATPAVERTVYVGPVNVCLEGSYDRAVSSGRRLTHSLALGLGAAMALSDDERFLVLTADIPWVTAEVLTRFVTEAPAADLVYPAIRKQAAEAQFPFQERTYARLREGRLTGGNAVLLTRAVVPSLLTVLERVFRARKNPFVLASIVGVDVLLALLLGRASIPKLERRVSAILEADVRAFITDDAALAADVDRPAHMPGGLTALLPGTAEGGVR